MAPDDDAADLRARVRELEQTLADHQATIEQLRDRGVGRRAILAGGAGLVGGAALTGQASAQSAAGQVGTSSEPVDVEAASVTADSVDAGSVSADSVDAGSVNTESADVENQLSAGSIKTDLIENDKAQFITTAIFDPPTGWHPIARFGHDGGVNRSILAEFEALAAAPTSSEYQEQDIAIVDANNDGSWGTTGDTRSISTHQRLRVGNDTSELFYEIDVPRDFLSILIKISEGGQNSGMTLL